MTTTAPVRFIPLGGLGEIGMNCMAVEHGEDRFIIDCGLSFDGRGLGVDVLHADFSWLLEHPERLKAIVLTHGHEDHIGAVPYLLAQLLVPIYGPPYALSLVRERLSFDAPHLEPDLRPMAPGDRIAIGPFEIEPYRVTHSMPDCTGLIIRTPQGVVVHSGDFKIEEDPVDGECFDFPRLERLREEEGVRLLLSDSTNSLTEGSTGPEREVATRLEHLVREAPSLVAVTLFASNVHRLRSLAEVARRTERKLCLLGRSLGMHARLAQQHGYLPDLADIEVSRELAHEIPRDRLLVLATGTQGEPPAAFARLALGNHPDLDLRPGDRVIHSARIIPGNERAVYALINSLSRRKVEVIWRAVDPAIHVSGHAHRGEQRTLIRALQPESFLPVHGTFIHLEHHAQLARECGVKNVVVAENGAIVALGPSGVAIAGQVPTGRVFRERGAPITERVIRDRQLLAELGVAVVTCVVDRRGRPNGPIEIVTRGIFYEDDNQPLLDEACEHVHRALMGAKWVVDRPDEDDLELEVRRALKRFFGRRLRKKPLCYGVVLRADP